MVPYAEHEAGYSEFISLALLKTTKSVYQRVEFVMQTVPMLF